TSSHSLAERRKGAIGQREEGDEGDEGVCLKEMMGNAMSTCGKEVTCCQRRSNVWWVQDALTDRRSGVEVGVMGREDGLGDGGFDMSKAKMWVKVDYVMTLHVKLVARSQGCEIGWEAGRYVRCGCLAALWLPGCDVACESGCVVCKGRLAAWLGGRLAI
ncbi:hypothetical protein HaLaN_20434, partial [Haematococcus lacustris]